MASHSSSGPVKLITLYNNCGLGVVPDLDPTIARFSALGYSSFKKSLLFLLADSLFLLVS
jgi:hypothetical protein